MTFNIFTQIQTSTIPGKLLLPVCKSQVNLCWCSWQLTENNWIQDQQASPVLTLCEQLFQTSFQLSIRQRSQVLDVAVDISEEDVRLPFLFIGPVGKREYLHLHGFHRSKRTSSERSTTLKPAFAAWGQYGTPLPGTPSYWR